MVLPLTVEEYQVGQLWSVAEASRAETGGGEGVEVLKNEPYTDVPLLAGQRTSGQYTHKIYHLQSKVPAFIRMLAPRGSLSIHEEAWNAYPYCRTVLTNPDYMKDNFVVKVETIHLPDRGQTENAHQLSPAALSQREVVQLDIANDPVNASDYKDDTDPKLFKSAKTGRGPLNGRWQDAVSPVMCAYKLVTVEFKWWGLQGRIEKFIQAVSLSLSSASTLSHSSSYLLPLFHLVPLLLPFSVCSKPGHLVEWVRQFDRKGSRWVNNEWGGGLREWSEREASSAGEVRSCFSIHCN